MCVVEINEQKLSSDREFSLIELMITIAAGASGVIKINSFARLLKTIEGEAGC